MKPLDSWYTTYTSDPLAPKSPSVTTCTISAPCTIAAWQKAFPSAKVIQIEILYGLWTNYGQIIYIDDVSIHGMVVPIEPEVIAATP
jgi:hypothetical protein